MLEKKYFEGKGSIIQKFRFVRISNKSSPPNVSYFLNFNSFIILLFTSIFITTLTPNSLIITRELGELRRGIGLLEPVLKQYKHWEGGNKCSLIDFILDH